MEPCREGQRPSGERGTHLSKNAFVGNILYDSTGDDLRDWRYRGFGFVVMADGAENANSALNGFYPEGRPLIVHEDRPQHQRCDGKFRHHPAG
jgi:RNA recognition motif-containing protein